MNDYQLIISPATRDDLSNIYRFGLGNWGANQTAKYLDHVKNQFWLLTTQPFMGIERPELLPGLRSLPVKSHVMFYRIQSDHIEIIRMLHGRQDPNRHIK